MQFRGFYSDFGSEKSYKGANVLGLILGDITTALQDCLKPPRHGFHQDYSFTPKD